MDKFIRLGLEAEQLALDAMKDGVEAQRIATVVPAWTGFANRTLSMHRAAVLAAVADDYPPNTVPGVQVMTLLDAEELRMPFHYIGDDTVVREAAIVVVDKMFGMGETEAGKEQPEAEGINAAINNRPAFVDDKSRDEDARKALGEQLLAAHATIMQTMADSPSADGQGFWLYAAARLAAVAQMMMMPPQEGGGGSGGDGEGEGEGEGGSGGGSEGEDEGEGEGKGGGGTRDNDDPLRGEPQHGGAASETEDLSRMGNGMEEGGGIFVPGQGKGYRV